MTPNEIGFTDLIGQHGVSKSNPRFDAIGALDEASSAISLAKAFCGEESQKSLLERSQRDLMLIMAELAGMESHDGTDAHALITEALVTLDSEIEKLKGEVPNPRQFILGGSSPYSGALNLARAIARRSERETLKLYELEGPLNRSIAQYLNRLSMLLFLLEVQAEGDNR